MTTAGVPLGVRVLPVENRWSRSTTAPCVTLLHSGANAMVCVSCMVTMVGFWKWGWEGHLDHLQLLKSLKDKDLCLLAPFRLKLRVPRQIKSSSALSSNPGHVLHDLLLPAQVTRYSIRLRSHNREIPCCDSLTVKEFVSRMLYRWLVWH